MLFPSSPSTFSLLACVGYAGVAALCCCAAIKLRSGNGESLGKGFWGLCGLFFLLLIGLRLVGFEAIIEQALRGWFSMRGEYSMRQDLQRPIAAAAVFVLGIVSLFIMRCILLGRLRWPFSQALARAGIFAMLSLIGLRAISLHAIDALLYHGPHLNWLVDTGGSLLVALGAVLAIGNFPEPGFWLRATGKLPKEQVYRR